MGTEVSAGVRREESLVKRYFTPLSVTVELQLQRVPRSSQLRSQRMSDAVATALPLGPWPSQNSKRKAAPYAHTTNQPMASQRW
ncbi:hypothetical protein ACIA8G_19710 [Lentzea sp. NPDC051213]|uniref:hypothetical protein n=1 Tax=Lentzea sp. NPDC051213 TaxID=3364126 RepID=UPI00378E6496